MAKKLTWWEVAEIIGVTDLTSRRWRERMEADGYYGLAKQRKGKASRRRLRGGGHSSFGEGGTLRFGQGRAAGLGNRVSRGCRSLLQAAEGGADRLDILVLRAQGLAARRTAVQMAEYFPHLFRLQSTQGELLEQVHGGMLFVFHCCLLSAAPR